MMPELTAVANTQSPNDSPAERCEACRRAPVEVVVSQDDPEQPYRVCPTCQRRLERYALRPLEWFNLAAIHSPWKHLLRDEFYDSGPRTLGKALQPEEPVEEARRFPIPKLREIRNDLERLLDYAMTQLWLETQTGQQITVALTALSQPDALLAALQRRVASHNFAIETTAYTLCGTCLGATAADWLRERGAGHYRDGLLLPLAKASAICLPQDEGFAFVADKLAAMDAATLRDNVFALSSFPGPMTCDWMEQNVDRASTDAWGRTATHSGISWARVAAWLEAGRPLSHVALSALQQIYTPAPLSPLLVITPLVLEDPAPFDVTTTALNAYVARDSVPNVRRRVQAILAALPPQEARED